MEQDDIVRIHKMINPYLDADRRVLCQYPSFRIKEP